MESDEFCYLCSANTRNAPSLLPVSYVEIESPFQRQDTPVLHSTVTGGTTRRLIPQPTSGSATSVRWGKIQHTCIIGAETTSDPLPILMFSETVCLPINMDIPGM